MNLEVNLNVILWRVINIMDLIMYGWNTCFCLLLIDKNFFLHFLLTLNKRKKMDDKLKAMMEIECNKMSDKISLLFVPEKRKLVRE